MAHRHTKVLPVKYISKRVCQEQFDCDGDSATFECYNCGTRQCGACEKLLHKPERQKFASHIRRKIEQLSCAVECALCPYKPAEYSCLECKTVVCRDCNKEYHRGKLNGHHRTLLPKQKQEDKEDPTNSPTSDMSLRRSSPENCLPISPFLDSLSEPTPCEIKERQTSILTGEISTSAAGLNLIDELGLESDFHSLTTSVGQKSLSSPDNLDIEREEFLSLDSVGTEQSEPKSLEFLSGHFESLDRPHVAQSSAIAIPQRSTSDGTCNVNREASGVNVTHRTTTTTTRPTAKPGRGSHVNKRPILSQDQDQVEKVTTAEELETRGIQEITPATSDKHLDPKKIEFNNSNTSKSEVGSSHSQSSLHSLESSSGSGSGSGASARLGHASASGGSKPRMEAIVKPVGSVKAVPSSSPNPREKGGLEGQRKTAAMSENLKHPSGKAIPPADDEISLIDPHQGGFLLVNDAEVLQVKSAEDFVEQLQCQGRPPVKVISIFGNTGDGKSHTLNHTFFGGQEVFHTSPTQDSCTIGVWAAYDERTNIVAIDTEGLLGVSSNENKRTRLLLKVIAISDVVIYRTRADRLHRDLFQFLGDASKAYLKHFTPELKLTLEKCDLKGPVSTLGPAVIVFHETTHTLPLGTVLQQGRGGNVKSADTLLQERFKEHDCHMGAFSCLQYIGTQTMEPPTNFKPLKEAILNHIDNSSVRSPRSPEVIYHALKGLNDKFSGAIDRAIPSPFPDEYFTCSSRCLSCETRCTNTMNHCQDNIPHENNSRCKYQHQFDNRVYICKSCYQGGQEVVVVPKMCSATDNSWMGMIKYAVSGFVLECPHCGVIYRSRQYWYGNQEPEMEAVRTEIRHVWPGGSTVLQGTHNAGRRLLDGFHQVVDVVSSVSAKPTKMMSQWMMDQIAPPYWRPNAEITACFQCKKPFEDMEKMHHCRDCGEGFCDECSQHQLPVPERGWGAKPVRVCDGCYKRKTKDVGGGKMPADLAAELEAAMSDEPQPVTARKVGEVLQTTLGVLGTAVNYPAGMLIEAARPAYWIPDGEITQCIVCHEEFNPKLKIHHCRACGQGVCADCSSARRTVPSRGWDMPVRVCQLCNAKDGLL